MIRARAVLEFFNVDINTALPNYNAQTEGVQVKDRGGYYGAVVTCKLGAAVASWGTSG